jgi:arabinogalactan endo-1,4-beta-galactosidase
MYLLGLIIPFENSDRSMWNIIYENGAAPHKDYQQKASDAKTGDYSLHFYSGEGVNFREEQTITGFKPRNYYLSMFLQCGDAGGSAMYLYAKTGDKEYKADTSVNGWVNWSNSEIQNILVTDGTISIGASYKG